MDSTVTSKGQTTLPKAVRDRLNLKPGDRVKYFFHPDGSVVLLPTLPVAALKGIVKAPGYTVTLADMDQAIAAGGADVPPGTQAA